MINLTDSQLEPKRPGILDTNRKFKLSLGVGILAVCMFAVPESVTAFTEYDYHLLDQGGFITLIGLAIGVFGAANVASKAVQRS